MKNKHLIQAMEFAKRLGCIVTRKHTRDGLTAVTVTDKTGTQSAAKVYKTGSSNPQAMFIKKASKGFTLVEAGLIARLNDGSVFFRSEYGVLYRWHPVHEEWRLWLSQYNGSERSFRIIFAGRHCKAKVNVSKLRPGVKYYD